nr:MAG TPA: hypothetical protein [Caudoviricetes sp.]
MLVLKNTFSDFFDISRIFCPFCAPYRNKINDNFQRKINFSFYSSFYYNTFFYHRKQKNRQQTPAV